MAFGERLITEMLKMWIFSGFILFTEYVAITNGYISEYCSSDSFAPQCGANEVIVMKHAVYGRMRKGKCLSSNTGVGCEMEVLHVLDDMCSNKASCQLVVHVDLKAIDNPCPPDMLRYLDADYACEQVLQIDYSQCRSASTKIEVSTKLSVSSEVLAKSSCGSSSIHFSARPGQHLNISIIDFNYNEHQNNRHSCVNYLELIESPTGKTQPVCAGSYDRTGHVMLSSGHDVTAVFHVQDPKNQRFILNFEAIGCGDITPPEGTWVQRDGDETTLGCHSGRHSWTLRCERNQWVGAVGSCGTAVAVQHDASHTPTHQKWTIATGMLVFAFCSILLFICSTSFSIGVCVYTKGNVKSTEQSSQRYNQQTLPLFAHARQTGRADIPHNQVMIGQQQIIPPTTDDTKTDSDTTNERLYCNTMHSQTDSVYSDSVKYYVLENVHENNSVPT